MALGVRKEIFPLLLVLFIDSMGLGLVFPILNTLLADSQSGFLQGIWQHIPGNIIYGVFIGVFMLCWFVGAAILGDLSDQIGRKKSLLICLIGAFLGYLLSALAVVMHSMSLLLLGRILAGLTSGSQPIAQAATVDISTSENKNRNINLMFMVLSLGFIVGPMVGGVLSDKNIVSWFNLSVPLYFTAGIALLNVILLQKLFNETFKQTQKLNLKPHTAITIFVSAFKHPTVKRLSFIFFVFILGWSSFYSFIALFLSQALQFTPIDVSYFMAVMGLGFVIGNGFLGNYLNKRFSLKGNVMFSVLISGITVVAMLNTTGILLWILMIILACFVAVAYASVITLFSNQVGTESQGWIMGITGAIMAFVWGIDALALGGLALWDIRLPLVISAVCLFGSALLLINFKGQKATYQTDTIHHM